MFLLLHLAMSVADVSMSLYSTESYYWKTWVVNQDTKLTQVTQNPKQLLAVIAFNHEEEQMDLENNPRNCCKQGFNNTQHPLATARDDPIAMTGVTTVTSSWKTESKTAEFEAFVKSTQLLRVPPAVQVLVGHSTMGNHTVRDRSDIRGIAASSSQHTYSSASENCPELLAWEVAFMLTKKPQHCRGKIVHRQKPAFLGSCR